MAPTDGFLWRSRLSRVVELVSTSSIWNLKNMMMTTKNDIWKTIARVLAII